MLVLLVMTSQEAYAMNQNKAIQEETLRQLYVHEQLSGAEIARKIRASPAAVYNALIRFGIPLRSHSTASRLRWSTTWGADWKELAHRYNKGANLEDIAKEVGCSLATASEHLSNFTTIRSRGAESPLHPNPRGRIDIDVKKSSKMNKAGATLTEIGAELGVSVQIVSKRLQEAGVQVVVNKASKDEFKNVQSKKREVARAIGATKCTVCGEIRGVQLCHIQSRRKGGPLNPDNAVPLCPNHHDFFDHGRLHASELHKLKSALLTASEKGYVHHIYSGSRA